MAQHVSEFKNTTPELSQSKQDATSSDIKPQLLLLLPPNVNLGKNLVLLPRPQKRAPNIPKPYFQSVKGYISDPNKKAENVCRTCCRAIFNHHFIKLYDDKNKDNCERLRRMLKEVYPFVDLEIYLNPVMCTKCVQMLFDSYEFKTKCLDSEQRFNGWVSRREEVKSTEVNLLIKVESSTEGDDVEEEMKRKKLGGVDVKNPQLQTDVNHSVNIVSLDHDYVGVTPKLVVVPNIKKKFTYKALVDSNTILKPKKEKPEFLCEKCGQLTKNHHPSLHAHCTDGALYKCRHCDYIVHDLSVLEKHLETHIVHNCGQCNKNFSSLKFLRAHIKNAHLRNEPFYCHICGKSFKHRGSLYRHLVYHDTEKLTNLQCEKCSRKFKYEKNYKRHLRLHNGPVLSCGFCGKRTTREDVLKKHMQTVHPDKNYTSLKKIRGYSCFICGSRFSTHLEYTKHFKVHGMKIFMCEICGRRLKNNRSLKTHLQLSHDDKGTYKCQICFRGFWKQEYLIEHRFKVHQNRPRPEEAGKEEKKLGFEEFLFDDKNETVVQRMKV